MRIFITGGTGLVGNRLVARLRDRGDVPVILSRDRASAQAKLGGDVEVVEGDPTRSSGLEAIDTCDAVVNLAGENVFARRWSEEFKSRIRGSRVDATRNVVAAIARAPQRPKVLVNASAIGYYGPHGDEELTEDSPAGNDFLAAACVDWENTARALQSADVRLVIIRIGIVLSRDGGALQQMLTPFKLGVGGPVGNGRQYMSWIHIDDLVGLITYAIDQEAVSGVINGTAPGPVTNKEFSKALGRALGRPAFFPVPVFVLRVRFGQVAELLASGQRVRPERTLHYGFKFQFPKIDMALADLVT